jgi:hypothetical protein
MAAKKTTKKVALTVDLETLQKLIDAMAALGAPGFCFEKFVDDPTVARKLRARAKKKKAK